ncbi:magnesium transporter [Candidatus Aerophobetes bacterium]|uniref:Magnesium transporter MgtE n=1 Tax=Aerophobetes bacterium TaxID=2030807 RepID=A0A523UQB7_UNCAE|nr:MAG: magnesium transporter [Candidatus Aerophobetes bacterium]
MDREISRAFLIIPEIREFLSQNNREAVREIFYEYEPVEVAEILTEFSLKERVLLFSLWNIDFAADVFEKMEKDDQIALMGAIDEARKGKILNELAPDERVDFFEELPEEMVNRFLSIMEREEARDARELMTYDASTAGGRMTTEFARLKEDITVQQALEELRKTAKELEMIYYIYIESRYNYLAGVISLKELIMAEPTTKLSEIMHTKLITIPIDMDQEHVAAEIAKYDFLALPVVDNRGRMKGIITVDDVIDVIEEEDTEDMYKFGAAGEHVEDYMSMRPTLVARNRMTWLSILVVTSFLSGLIMQKFSFALESMIALSFFIPLIMGSGGNAGTQAAMVTVRGLATGEIRMRDIWRVVRKEFLIGAMLGGGLGVLALVRALIFQKSSLLGTTVAFSMIITVTAATCLGAILPLICKRLGIDPAVVSGPLITTVLDIASLLIYFRIAIFLLGLS